MEQAINKALKTWYTKDHPLHFDPLHPALGLAGEAGELLNLYKKERFKDGVSWWDCVKCGARISRVNELKQMDYLKQDENCCKYYSPKILDELGDAWYYLRILAYQQQIELAILKADIHDDILSCLVELNNHSSHILTQLDRNDVVSHYSLTSANNWFQMTLRELDFTLDQVTESNWQKLKDGDNHGWKEARQS